MGLSAASFELLRAIVRRLYERPFCEAVFQETAKAACAVMDAQYFSLFLLQQPRNARPLFLSNNPPDFIPVYLSVAKEDFLIRDVIETGGPCVLRRMHAYDVLENRNFIAAVQSARPISDVAYLPLMLNGSLWGYFAAGRAGLGRLAFSDDELHAFRFICSFIEDAFVRALAPPPTAEDEACLDFEGNVLASGARMREALEALFGERGARLGSAREERRSRLRVAIRAFVLEAPRPGGDRLCLEAGQRSFLLALSRVAPVPSAEGTPILRRDAPCVTLRLLPLAVASRDEPGANAFSLSPRERQVVDGIFACKSNKAIAAELRIDEATVKRYTHNIYEKTGFKTRVELVLGLPRSSIQP